MKKCYFDDNHVRKLVYEIFIQAIVDYRNLSNKTYRKKSKSAGACNIEEIEKFFNGNWCQDLLDGLNIKMTGQDILYRLKGERLEFIKALQHS